MLSALFLALCLAIALAPDVWLDRTTVALMLVQQVPWLFLGNVYMHTSVMFVQLAVASRILLPFMDDTWMRSLAQVLQLFRFNFMVLRGECFLGGWIGDLSSMFVLNAVFNAGMLAACVASSWL